jgi:hypothetical protein
VIDVDDLDDDYDDRDPDELDDWDSYIPDETDYEFERAYEEHIEHCEAVHGGGDCDCRPSVLQRLGWRIRDTARRLRYRTRTVLAARQARNEPPF